jgi:biotin operon repressor
MAKVKQFERVLEMLQNASPKSVSKETLAAKLGKDVEMYRISTYIWEVKNKAGVPVEAIKDGRKVVGFRVVDATTVPAPATEASEATEETVADAATA